MIFGILVGVVIGYIFKPQLDVFVMKGIRYIKNKSREVSEKDSHHTDY